MTPTERELRAAEAFYRRCPTEIASDGAGITRKTWEELTEQERFHVVAGIRAAAEMLAPKGWRSMDTAPKDTGVLLWTNSALALGHFNTALNAWVANWDHRPLKNVELWQPAPEFPRRT